MIGNCYPPPIGVTVSFSQLVAGGTTPNFSWGEPGRFAVTWEADDGVLGGVTLIMQQVVGTTTSTYQSSQSPGRFDVVLPVGGGTFNFTNTVGAGVGVNAIAIRRVSMTKLDQVVE